MPIKIVNNLPTELIHSLQTKVNLKNQSWIEGVDNVGFWPQGNSFIFSGQGQYFCISKEFLSELLFITEGGEE